MLDVFDADSYMYQFVIDNQDWLEADVDKKTRILNVAERTLKNDFKGYVVPDSAVFEFASTLAVVFNDTNRLQQHGIASFAVTGVASFTFKENAVKSSSGLSISSFVTQEVFDILNEANPDKPKLGGKRVKEMTL